jgi:sialate O-acetylesterase
MPTVLLLTIMLATLTITAAHAAVPSVIKMPAIFSDHMVLQRGCPVPIWGTAPAGTAITVTFRTQRHSTTADAEGRWMVRLATLDAGGPDILTVNDRTFADVLVSEVWLGSGQSNMNYPMGNQFVAKHCPEFAPLQTMRHPGIRLAGGKGLVPLNGWKALEGEAFDYPAIMFTLGWRLQ